MFGKVPAFICQRNALRLRRLGILSSTKRSEISFGYLFARGVLIDS